MKSSRPFFQRRHFLIAGILTFIFLFLTKVLATILITQHVIYDTEAICIKAGKLAALLTWPLSDLLPPLVVKSYYFIPFVFLFYVVLAAVQNHCHLFLKKRKVYPWIFSFIVLAFLILRLHPNMLCALDGNESSESIGTSGNGSLKYGKRLLFSGNNFQYFNFLSYLKGNCFVHQQVKKALLEAYKTCERTCPGIEFTTGEGSLRRGGPFIINHRTHQNGMSLDLLLAFKKDSLPYNPINLFNAYGYGLETDTKGYINQSKPINWYPANTQIDFETNARFLLALSDACRRHGLRIRIVILKTELVPYLLATPSGKKIQAQNIRFACTLPPLINQAHDDHFHVDFELIN